MRKKFVAVVFDVIIVADDAISDIQTQTHTYIHKHDRANFKKERKKNYRSITKEKKNPIPADCRPPVASKIFTFFL